MESKGLKLKWYMKLHVLKREMVYVGMLLMKYLPVSVVDAILVGLAKLKFGDMSAYGICRPKLGPMQLKFATGKTPVIDVGTISKIQDGQIKVSVLIFFFFQLF